MLTGLTFLFFIITLIIAIIRKNKKLWLAAFGALLIFSGLALFTGIKMVSVSYQGITNFFKPRTGEEIYTGLFDKKQPDCVKIISYMDAVIPKMDDAIWLYFETCPEELKRILAGNNFISGKIASADVSGEIPDSTWITPDSFGDTVLIYNYFSDDNHNFKTIWASMDSTKVIYRDVMD